jgi:Na+/glutamate symporter
VFGRILPALGLMMCLSTFYHAWLAYRLAKKTGRSDVCAMPPGVSVPHMFIVTFVIMLPITLATKDPIKGWEAGLVWVFFQSFILMIGGFIAPNIRMITPRAALLGTLAGAVLTYFGFMHGDAVGVGHGLGVTPSVALSYLIVAGFLFMLARAPVIIDAPAKQAAVPAE